VHHERVADTSLRQLAEGKGSVNTLINQRADYPTPTTSYFLPTTLSYEALVNPRLGRLCVLNFHRRFIRKERGIQVAIFPLTFAFSALKFSHESKRASRIVARTSPLERAKGTGSGAAVRGRQLKCLNLDFQDLRIP